MASVPLTTSRGLALNTATNIAVRAANALAGLFLIGFFLRTIGDEMYGIWIVIGSIFSYRRLLGLGLNSAVNRYVPMCMANEDFAGVVRVASTALSFFLILAGILALASLVVYLNLDSWIEISPALIPPAKQLVMIVGVCYSVSLPLQLGAAVLSGMQRYVIINANELLAVVLRVSLLVAFLTKDQGLWFMGLVFGGSTVLTGVINLAILRKLAPYASVSFRSIDLRLLREMLGYGISGLLYMMATIVIYRFADIIIGAFLAVDVVPRFYAATSLVLLLDGLVQMLFSAMKPAITDLDAHRREAQVREMSLLTQKYTLLFLIPSVAFFFVMARPFLSVWLGDRFPGRGEIDEMAAVLMILCVGHGLWLTQHSSFVVLLGRGYHRMFALLSVAGMVVCGASSLLSILVFEMGLPGIAWSCSITMGAIAVLGVAAYFRHIMRIPVRESLREVWLPALRGTALALAALVAWRWVALPDTWMEIVCGVAVVAALTMVGAWFLSLTRPERLRFKRLAGMAQV